MRTAAALFNWEMGVLQTGSMVMKVSREVVVGSERTHIGGKDASVQAR